MLDKHKYEDILEKAIDKQYKSETWGLDPYSVAVYKLIMRFSDGVHSDPEIYRLSDQMSWKKIFEKLDLLIKLIEAGKSYQEIIGYDIMLWHDTMEYIEGYLGIGGLTYNLKNSIDVEKNMDRALYELHNIKKVLLKKKKLISFIHDNKYRYAFHMVFE